MMRMRMKELKTKRNRTLMQVDISVAFSYLKKPTDIERKQVNELSFNFR